MTDDYPANRLDEFLPWNWQPSNANVQIACKQWTLTRKQSWRDSDTDFSHHVLHGGLPAIEAVSFQWPYHGAQAGAPGSPMSRSRPSFSAL
jgi:hypothetical protein